MSDVIDPMNDDDAKQPARPQQQQQQPMTTTTTTTSLLLDVPSETIYNIIQYMMPIDILSFLSTHSKFHTTFGHSQHFWDHLHNSTQSIYGTTSNNNYDNHNSATTTGTGSSQTPSLLLSSSQAGANASTTTTAIAQTTNTTNVNNMNNNNNNNTNDWKKAKYRNILHSHLQTLSCVRWYAVDTSTRAGITNITTATSRRMRDTAEGIITTTTTTSGRQRRKRRSNSDADFDNFMMNLLANREARDAGVPDSEIYNIVPNEREGHVACMIGNYMVVTGGFCTVHAFDPNNIGDTNTIYIKHINTLKNRTSWTRVHVLDHDPTTRTGNMDEKMSSNNTDVNKNKKFVYGATMTQLDDTRAIMFGGFQTGGYMNETTQVAILHLVEVNDNAVVVTETMAEIAAAAAVTAKSKKRSSSKPPPPPKSTTNVKAWWEVIDCNVATNDPLGNISQSSSTLYKGRNCDDTNRSFVSNVGRAYHAATLLYNRYLLIVGGIQSGAAIHGNDDDDNDDDDDERGDGSILKPILLDCTTWTWYLDNVTTSSSSPSTTVVPTATKSATNEDALQQEQQQIDTKQDSLPSAAAPETETFLGPLLARFQHEIPTPEMPSGRHGCSLIPDYENSNRNRILLFGGGSGSDLLRSGSDNTEVWELLLNGTSSAPDVLSLLPFQWRIIHKDQALHPILQMLNNRTTTTNNNNDNSNRTDYTANRFNPLNAILSSDKHNRTADVNFLNTVERLNLSRCHCAHRVSRDIVFFAFGSGRPTTNGTLCYNLRTDSFFRTPLHEYSHVPRSRFSCASVFVEAKGIIVYHGGYSTEGEIMGQNGPLSDTLLLDLAPNFNVSIENGRIWLPINTRVNKSSLLNESAVQRYSLFGNLTVM